MFIIAGDKGTHMMCSVFNSILKKDTSTEKWAESVTVPLFKGNGDALDYGKYCCLRILEHGIKIWERILMRLLEACFSISLQHFDFAAEKSTTDAMFIAR